jgi:CBS domain-containing protein
VILDKKHQVAGILSIIDLLRAMQPSYLTYPKPSTADSLQYSPIFWRGLFTLEARKLGDRKIRDIMSGPAKTIDGQTNLMEIANFMVTEGVRRAIVTHRGVPVGVVREQELFFQLAHIISRS